ncbi:GntR family transcriptional regulator [Tsukamurella sp. 8F]|uniref:GntR family transcriptional regulator n=1 Tax=unclassified Tsukamurella TaxID=2633480 RepID=UPI0023B98412|nr:MULTISPECIES: GntR family transcriptional regulator [unclassified Tsukamurella]MDF0528762.1 GntR family transcriptional regulator [Tsukamurella sp. 8J]MDF0586597.1 GntR family transcriptional regulator [Tsukamurella sp. 8F]
MGWNVNAKYQRVAALLEERIRDGDLADGQKLPGEADMARDLQVSRGTVRHAIGELQRRALIHTQVGVGSFVTFDGVALDTPHGWANALTVGGHPLEIEILDIERRPASDVPDAPCPEAILVRRVRKLPGDRAVSYESALLPATGILRELPETGLVNQSLTATLAMAGLRAARGEQDVGVDPLPADAADAMSRPTGSLFLRSVRTSYARSGEFVEHVVSYLDPQHFRLHVTFGDAT